MTKIYNYIIVLTVFLVWLSFYISENILNIIGVVAILSLGLIHGSNDVTLIKSLSKKKSILKFLIYYTLFVILFALAFYFIPKLSLLVFIIASGYHFGEQHWVNNLKFMKHQIKPLYYTVYGNLIIGLILLFNKVEATKIIFDLTDVLIRSEIFLYNVVVSLFFCVLGFFILFYSNKTIIKLLPVNLFYLILLCGAFYSSNLIWSFTLYFVLWHSLPSMRDQIEFNSQSVNLKNLIIYIKQSFIYWLISLVGLGLFFYLLKDTSYSLSILFAFIASVTLPHVLVMKHMFQKKVT